MVGPSPLSSWRLAVVALLLSGSAMALLLRVGSLQLSSDRHQQPQTNEDYRSQQTLFPARGAVRDRAGHPLALTVATFDLLWNAAVPGAQAGGQRTAATLSRLLKLSEKELADKMASATSDQKVLLKPDVPYDVGTEIEELSLPGLEITQRIKRVYPEGDMAASLLGFVGRDRLGLTGIEADFNQELAGVPGTLAFERDSLGNPIPLGYRRLQPPQLGADVYLTLDRFVQRLAERKLDEAMKKHRAKGGTIIVMEPATGAVLAMASRPTFRLTELDLMNPKDMDLYRNRAVTDTYEPGSTFKVITMAGALDAGKVTPQTTFLDVGPVIKYGWAINTYNGQHHGTETMAQVLKNSCNVGAVWVSDQLGPELFYDYVVRFGFGQLTSIGLSGEASGQVRLPPAEPWSPIDLATNSFGQGLSVTPLQMVTAISAVANGGLLMRPYLVHKVAGDQGERVFLPVVVRRVISKRAAELLNGMLIAAGGLTGDNRMAVMEGFSAAGKTGTASIPLPGGYTSPGTIASFVGYAPAEAPRLAMVVKIDEPQDVPWGSVVAAPIFSAMAREILIHWQVPPTKPVALRKPG